MHWILILFAYAGAMADHDEMSLTHIQGFSTRSACANAGSLAVKEFQTPHKSIKFVCVSDQDGLQ